MYKGNTKCWTIERTVFLIAGILILTSVILGLTISAKFFYFTGLVGLMQIIFATTGFCPMAIILNKIGIKTTCQLPK